MDKVEIILDADGIEDQLKNFKEKYQLELDFDSEASLDGVAVCSVIGTAVNVGMFLMQLYSLWGNKRVGIKTDDFEASEMTINKIIDYLNSKKSNTN